MTHGETSVNKVLPNKEETEKEEFTVVFEKIRTIIAQQLSISEDKITPETSLKNDIGADSLDIFQIVSNIEEEFNMEFAVDSVEQMKTVADAVEYIIASADK